MNIGDVIRATYGGILVLLLLIFMACGLWECFMLWRWEKNREDDK